MKTYLLHISQVATLVAAIVMLQGCETQAKESAKSVVAVPVKMLQVPLEQSSRGVNFVAEVIATREAELAFQVPGVAAQFDIKMGDQVKQGQLLAALDPNDYLLAVEARQAEFELAAVKLNQAERLSQKQLISEDQYDQAKTRYTAAQTRLDEAMTDLDDSRIVAPFSGVVSLTYINPHQYVRAKQPVLKIIELDRLDLTFNLPVHLAEKLAVEKLKAASLTVSIARFKGMQLPATFKQISTQPDPDTNSYVVELTIERPPTINILPGMAGMVRIKQQDTDKQLVRIPAGAITSRSGSSAQIWLVHPHSMTLHKVNVELDENNYLVSGLNPGDKFVSAGASSLVENQLVKAWQRERGI